jgi:hypothetical protein
MHTTSGFYRLAKDRDLMQEGLILMNKQKKKRQVLEILIKIIRIISITKKIPRIILITPNNNKNKKVSCKYIF